MEKLDLNLESVSFNFGNAAKTGGFTEPVATLEMEYNKNPRLVLNNQAMVLMGLDHVENYVSFIHHNDKIYLFNTSELERKDRLHVGKNGSIRSKKVLTNLINLCGVTLPDISNTSVTINYKLVQVEHDTVTTAYLEELTNAQSEEDLHSEEIHGSVEMNQEVEVEEVYHEEINPIDEF